MAGPPAPPAGQGDTDAGYYGTVDAADFIDGPTLAQDIGLTAGTAYNSDTPWLKFAWNGGIVMVPQKPFRYGISWNSIYLNGSVYGDGLIAGESGAEDHNTNSGGLTATRQDTKVTIDGVTYKVRLMRCVNEDPYGEICGDNNEWNNLILPIHEDAPNSFSYSAACAPTADWGIDFTGSELVASNYMDGSYNWGQETPSGDSVNRVGRGFIGVSHVTTYDSGYTGSRTGWRPLLEKI